MVTADGFRFDSVVIVESLDESDIYASGTKLHQLILALSHRVGLRSCELHRVATAEEFCCVLEKLARDTSMRGSSPILHLEMHGNRHGVVLASEECVSWGELADLLRDTNVAARLNLLLVLAVCDGAHFVQSLLPTKRAPVWAVVGPVGRISVLEAASAYPSFYRVLLTALDGRLALEQMNGRSVGGGPWQYHVYPARFMFRMAFHGYLEQYCTEHAIERRVDAISAKAVRAGWRGGALDLLKQQFRVHLDDVEGAFERFRQLFFMIDLYPENVERFPITLEDCRRHPSADDA